MASKMSPPKKCIITSDQEEILWEKKCLALDTSTGLLQAVIFYLIKCFGLWQAKELKQLTTEHVTFGQDEIGKFVTVDIKAAVGSGKVIKRYDDASNPRSVYKLLKIYRNYVANEGPFLVRPINSIKHYVCYSPGALGINIIDQTVANLAQESGIGEGFGNVSVCLLAIDILKSFGAGSHCISTWMCRLYPMYKKNYWLDIFKECSTINCEDQSKEACLMISHLLDPPYPTDSPAVMEEMRRKEAIERYQLETDNALRANTFHSWLSNIKTEPGGSPSVVYEKGAKKSTKLGIKTGRSSKTTGEQVMKCGGVKGKSPKMSVTDSRMSNQSLKVKSSEKLLSKSSTSSMSSASSSSSISQHSKIKAGKNKVTHTGSKNQNLAIKSELNIDKSDISDVKIMTVLSIPESAFSVQVNEGVSSANDTEYSEKSSGEEESSSTIVNNSEVIDTALSSKRQTEIFNISNSVKPSKSKKPRLLTDEGEQLRSLDDKKGGLNREEEMEVGTESHYKDEENTLAAASENAEVENESDEDSEAVYDDTILDIGDCDDDDDEGSVGDDSDHLMVSLEENDSERIDSVKHHSDNRSSSPPLLQGNLKKRNCSSTESEAHGSQKECRLKLSSADKKPSVSVSSEKSKDSLFSGLLKSCMVTAVKTSSPVLPLNVTLLPPPDQTKDSIEILRKLLQHRNDTTNVLPDSETSRSTRDNEGDVTESVSSSEDKFLHHSLITDDGVQIKCDRSDSNAVSVEAKTCIQNYDDDEDCQVELSPPSLSPQPACLETDGDSLNKTNTVSSKTPSPDDQNASEIVRFLDAAQVQMQSLLQASHADLVVRQVRSVDTPYTAKNSSLDFLSTGKSGVHSASFKSHRSHNDKESMAVSETQSISSCKSGHDSLALQDCDNDMKSQSFLEISKADIGTSSQSGSGISESQQCSQNSSPGTELATKSVQSPDMIEAHASSPSDKDLPCPLLRSALQRPMSPLAWPETSTQESSFNKLPDISSPGSDSQEMNEEDESEIFISVPLKTPLSLHTQHELDKAEKAFYSSSSDKFVCKPSSSLKYKINTSRCSGSEGPIQNGKITSSHLFQLKNSCKDQPSSPNPFPSSSSLLTFSEEPSSASTSVYLSSSITPTSLSSTSSLQDLSVDPTSNSGIYCYSSDHQARVAYQTIQVSNEKLGTARTFTIADLPMDPPKSQNQKESIGLPASEVNLGDYFPPGTMIPASGLKLLTEQSSTGLTVVLKFDYHVSGDGKSNSNSRSDPTVKDCNERKDKS